MGERTEVVDQADLVALHDNAGGNDDAPGNGLGVQLDALQQRHLALLGGGGSGVLDDIVVRLGRVGDDGLDLVGPHNVVVAAGRHVGDLFVSHDAARRECE